MAAPSAGWAKPAAEKLRRGESASFRPHSRSMLPRIKFGQLCTVEPLAKTPVIGDVVFCRVRNYCYLRLIKAVNPEKGKYLVGDNHGRLNGWINMAHIYGRLAKVED